MRPLMTRFCVFYSLETGVLGLCIVSILVSGGLICNHHFKIPNQIRDWRNVSIYNNSQLDMLELNTNIAIWVLASDIMLTLLMLLPAAMTDVTSPWEKRNSVRKILIPSFIGKILCILHGMVGFAWITWKFHYDCPEIIGILLALAVYVILGWYLIVVVISYYLELGMRRTFHKLTPSKTSSARGSQHTQISYQRAELANSDESVPIQTQQEKVRKSTVPEEAPLQEKNHNSEERKYTYGDKETYKGSKRKLYEYDDEDGRERTRSKDAEGKRHQRPERASRSSQEALEKENQRYGSKDRLRGESNQKAIEDREEQYRKLLNKSKGSQENLEAAKRDGSSERVGKERHRHKENIGHVGVDGMKYRVSEREASDGEGKRRYYYKAKKRDHYEPPQRDDEDEIESPERTRREPLRYQRDSEGSLESLGRMRSPPKYAPRHSQSDASHDSYEPPKSRVPRNKEPRRHAPPRSPPRSPPQSPPGYTERVHYDNEPREDDRRYPDERPLRREPDQRYEAPGRYDYVDNDRRRYSSREEEEQYPGNRYEPDDYDYDGNEYVPAPPYVDTRYEDGYISSEV